MKKLFSTLLPAVSTFVFTALVAALVSLTSIFPSAEAIAADLPMTQGVIKKVDPASRKVLIKHGPVVNLDMSAMTMSFKVKPGIPLDTLKEGDEVQFIVIQEQNQYLITTLEKK